MACLLRPCHSCKLFPEILTVIYIAVEAYMGWCVVYWSGIMVIPWLIVAVAILILMFWRFKSAGMLIAMSCSAVISAACHPTSDDVDAAKKPVKWDRLIWKLRVFVRSLGLV
ncbi:unnamed protein product [Penicillium nalgiovense]|uniref:Uncharacterized protein n=1 Tax=Penicillium nalgiovense TaxID=60175 RepID=A0A9W4I018_PENNA|nr:unnamed protein product [Penicillium nalgiovense]CAG7948982.1 unnamed protein product [Penicillium nalgiovense]CAG7949126.1 unnamed protein product [Penicillium nalgiovense]CAG7979524.1 unnamed protein product [Penicillium nalgiovense]CAG7989905.1 unnamed protein product [Penicillium nalgiovense]